MYRVFSKARAFSALFACMAVFLSHAVAETTTMVSERAGNVPALAPRAGHRPKVAIVLAGGGARGMAHVGVLKVLEELGIPVDIVTGTSMGAIVGGLYSVGYDPQDIDAIMTKTDWVDLFTENGEKASEPFPDKRDRAQYFAKTGFNRNGIKFSGGFLSGRKILHSLDALFLPIRAGTDFDSLPRQFRAVSVDIASGQKVVHKAGPLPDAIRASMSIPGVFMPYQYNGQAHVDGFVVDNLPIDLARELGADYVLAIDLVDEGELDPEQFSNNVTTVLTRTVTLMQRNGVNYQIPDANLVITVNTHGYTTADFMKAREIIDLGERTARENAPALAAFRDKCLAAGAKPISVPEPSMPVIQAILVNGGTEQDRAIVRVAFEPFVGIAPSRDDIERVFAQLDRDVRFESVRIRLVDDHGRPSLAISIKDKPLRSAYLRASFLYRSTYSRYFVNEMTLAPGVIVQGVPFKDTRVTVDVDALDSPGLRAEIAQPFFDHFAISLYYAAHAELNTWVANAAHQYVERSRSATVGARLALYSWTGGEVYFGCGYDWLGNDSYEGVVAGTSITDAFCVHAGINLDTTDAPILPRAGLLVKTDLLYSFPIIAEERAFQRVAASGGVFIPFGEALSLGVRWEGGTDLTLRADGKWAAPAYYKPTLSDRHLFPGLLTTSERIGSHVAGGGVTVQYALNSNTASKSLPICALLQVSGGMAVPNVDDFAQAIDFTHFTGTSGLGVRINDAFGLTLRGGVTRNTQADWLPFFAIDLGSIGL